MVSRSGTEDGLARNILENVSLSNIARLYIQIKVEHFTGCHFEIFASYCIIFAETLVFFIHQIYSRNTQRLHFLPYELVCRPYPHEANSAGLVPFKISPGARNAAALPLQPFRLRGCPLPQGSASENPAPPIPTPGCASRGVPRPPLRAPQRLPPHPVLHPQKPLSRSARSGFRTRY